jgi:hypothetical protein
VVVHLLHLALAGGQVVITRDELRESDGHQRETEHEHSLVPGLLEPRGGRPPPGLVDLLELVDLRRSGGQTTTNVLRTTRKT